MKIVEKLIYIQDSMKLNDRDFCAHFSIKTKDFLKWKAGLEPQKEEVKQIALEFNLDVDDFCDSNSSLLDNPSNNEHTCKMGEIKDRNNIIYEDYVREDNSRYEEKD